MHKNLKVVHLSSVHPRNDIRIFEKECVSLVNNGFNVTLLVADGLGESVYQGVRVIYVGKPITRIHRMIYTVINIKRTALRLGADIYHLHDPELLLIVKYLKRNGFTVIYDAHEDVAKQIISKPYLNPIIARIISIIFARFEKKIIKYLDCIIAATPSIAEKFKSLHNHIVIVNNYPLQRETYGLISREKEGSCIAYIGAISKIRGLKFVVQALSILEGKVKLHIAGTFIENDYYKELSIMDGWKYVIDHGQVSRDEVSEILGKSIAGIVTFLPVPNHVNSQPNKIFEYMASAIPVIASDFPLWKRIIKNTNSGICVNPESPTDIASAIEWILMHPDEALNLGENGRRAIERQYNWGIEEKSLIEEYKKLAGYITPR